jgi:hypothetical protein
LALAEKAGHHEIVTLLKRNALTLKRLAPVEEASGERF